MIVSTQKNDLVLVRQDEHCLHAGELLLHWGNENVGKPTPYDSLYLAIEKHDIGWKDADDDVLFDTEKGKPLHFTKVNLDQHLKFYGDGVEKVLEEDLYAGLILGLHWTGLYTRRYGYQPDFIYNLSDRVKAAILDQEKKWAELKNKLWNPTEQPRSQFENNLWLNYEIFQFLDRLSLTICMSDLEEEKKTTISPIRFTAQDPLIDVSISILGNGYQVAISPFPFDDSFELSVPSRRIADKQYREHRELVEELNKANQEIIHCEIIPG